LNNRVKERPKKINDSQPRQVFFQHYFQGDFFVSSRKRTPAIITNTGTAQRARLP
jgi:hypothetical protein